MCERKEERGGCQASPPLQPPPPASLGPAAPLRVDGDGAIIPRQFFSNAGSLCVVDAGTAVLFLSSTLVSSSFRLAFSPLPFYYPPISLLSLLRSPCVPFHRTRSASFALVPFPSSFRLPLSLLPPALRTRRTVWKGAPRKGTARTRAIKRRTSSSAPISVEGSPSLRYGTRGSISGGGNFSRRGGDEHQRPSSPSSRSLFLLQRCNRRLYYFRERERKCSKTEKRGRGGEWNGRGLFDTRG